MAKTNTTTKKTTTKTTTKKSTGKTRAEQSRELFMNIREYAVLGFRVGDGMFHMFDTLVTAISKKKMGVLQTYRYEVSQQSGRATFIFRIRKEDHRLYTVYAGADREDPKKSTLVLVGAGKTQFPFSERGVREIVKAIKADK